MTNFNNKKYIVAGNLSQFNSYVNSKNDDACYLYVNSRDMLLGLKDINGMFIGTWYDRPDIFDIISQLCIVQNKTAGKIVGVKNYQLLMNKLRDL